MNFKKRLKKLLGNFFYGLRPGTISSAPDASLAAFQTLGPQDLAIDCGANRGLVTQTLAQNGATVYAFEPDPGAFEYLVKATAPLPSVTCINKAVLDRNGITRLYQHLSYGRNPGRFSESSSLLASKRNVDDTQSLEVEVVDLAEFITNLGRTVNLLKIDCEGAEYQIINHLIDSSVLDRIQRILVETHAHAIPSLQPADRALRKRITELGLGAKIDLDSKHRHKVR